MALPPLTPEQRQAALDKAAASRRERAEVKNRLKNSGASIADVLEEGQRNEVIGKMRVVDLLQSMPGPGQGAGAPADGAARHRREPPGAGSRAPSRWPRSRRSSPRVTDAAPAEPAGPASRLVVLAGPTAVGKGTVAADVRERHPEVWISVSATTRPPRPGRAGRRALLVRRRRRVRRDDRARRPARVGGRPQGGPLRHPAPAGRGGAGRGPPGDAGDRPPGRPAGARDACRRRCSSSSSRRRGTSWSAGWSAGAPRPRRSGSAAWSPRARNWPPRRSST